jgi:GT2 family glycosyltransferase/glycosyltransferase involved in cell wall biosynthesis
MNQTTQELTKERFEAYGIEAVAMPVAQIEILSPTSISGWISTETLLPQELSIKGIAVATLTLSPRPDVEAHTGRPATGFTIVPEKKIAPSNIVGLVLRLRGEELDSPQAPIFFMPQYKDWEMYMKSSKETMMRIVANSGFFDAGYYASQVDAELDSIEEAVQHYHEHGWNLGLNPHPLFNTKFYLKNNVDVANCSIDPLFHFVFSGISENRVTSPDFDNNFYTGTYGSQIPVGVSAIQHYVCHGFAHFLQPLPWLDAVTVRAISKQLRGVSSIAEYYRQLYRHLKTPHAAMLSAKVGPSQSFTPSKVGTNIIVPFYREPYLIKLCLESLHRIAPELRAMNCRVIAVLDSPEDEQSVQAFTHFVDAVSDDLDIDGHINDINSGFVSSVNIGLRKSRTEKRNALLLNSDCVLAAGSLTEMLRVLSLDPMVGFVNPRSNNATIATYPKIVCDIGEHFALYSAIADKLPEISYTPTCVGFCMLISHTVLSNFGLLDVSYGAGYNEENDYVSRANRVGFRAAQANRAYAFHIGGTSFRHTDFSSTSNTDVLNARYPEYNKQIDMYFASRAQFAEQMVEGFAPTRTGKFRVLLDISQLGGHPNGTSLMATRLIREMVKTHHGLEFHVVSTPQAIRYNELDKIDNLTVHAGWGAVTAQRLKFAHVFRMGQPFRKNDLRKVLLAGATHSFFMLDTIAYDCGYIADQEMVETWEAAASSGDGFVYQSEFTRNQFERRFPDMRHKPHLVSYHSLSLDEYRPETMRSARTMKDTAIRPVGLKGIVSTDFALLVGNHFAHKDVLKTFNQLSMSFPQLPIVVIGDDSMKDVALNAHASIFLKSGDIATEVMELLYATAKAVVFPSFYEGFGLPIFDALAQNRRLFLRDNAINREITQAVGVPAGANNVIFYDDYIDLVSKFSRHLDEGEPVRITQHSPQTWRSSASEICDFIMQRVDGWDVKNTYRNFELVRGHG